MTVERPKTEQVLELAADFGLEASEADARSYAGLMAGIAASYDRLDELPEPTLPVKYPRTSGYRPGPEENPYNAWYWKAEIAGASDGPLAGKRVAIKDNVCVAGVPMMNGSPVLEGYVPEVDATVVTRILDAGGLITGKAACEDLCFSGGSHTNKIGPIRNPHKPTHSAGGSSSGSAALVAAGEVDMAIGGDQGGSIRMPAAWCGVYGLKPTHGLVPYTGVFPIELTLDHCGPMANSVGDVARLLAAIAGPDGLDPRQIGTRTQDYLAELEAGAGGMRVALLTEGFERPESEPVVDKKVRAAAKALEKAGATVE
nr:amidase [Actinomycetota bacterium]NIU22351.1 amidase [Actinomycetota bacterium]NIV58916.1 amidase [Actinomycetota bacterium]NIW32916.1 amidase [Actinomycetota bacterium]